MTPSSPVPALRRAALLLASLTALAAPAQAAFVQGDWDPPYGEPFSLLGWRGTTTIQVPTACLALSGTVLNTGTLCPTISVVNAEVEFYDVNDVSLTTVETLDFDGAVSVDRIFVNAGQVEAFALVPTGRVPGTSALAIPSTGSVPAFFELGINFAASSGILAVLFWYENATSPERGRNDAAFPAVVSVRQFDAPAAVPVPATLGLAVAALALLGAVRRR